MTKSKWSGRAVFAGAASLCAIVGAVFYSSLPPTPPTLPPYLQPPPGSKIEESRRLGSWRRLWGPEYYCRIRSPLGAWQTVRHMMRAMSKESQVPMKARTEVAQRVGAEAHEDSGGMALRRAGTLIFVDYLPQLDSGEIHAWLLVWPEPDGSSTIEFFYRSRF